MRIKWGHSTSETRAIVRGCVLFIIVFSDDRNIIIISHSFKTKCNVLENVQWRLIVPWTYKYKMSFGSAKYMYAIMHSGLTCKLPPFPHA